MKLPNRIRYLSPAEALALDARRHPAALLPSLLQTVGVIALTLVVGFLTGPDTSDDSIDTLLGLIVFFFVGRFAWKLANWWIDHIVVTNHRVVEITGLITRRVASMPLQKVTDMTYRRSLFGRLLGYGELVLESAGQKPALERIGYLPDPDNFYRTVTSLANAVTSERPHAEDADTGPLPPVRLS